MQELKWWQKGVFYQVYPRSFADGNGDGIGDLAGLTARLDYLQDLGVDAIWLSPHYPSPLVDCGYDIADYTGVAPEYGTLEEFQHFLDQAHRRGLRVILDLVLNHTSDQHPWFLASRSGRNSPERDLYIWRDGRNGGPPNNWLSAFGGSAWEYDPASDQYYYHYFFKEQPDLNWRNPEVKRRMFDVARFWLERGVDGFRLDAIGTIFERPDLPDHTAERSQAELVFASLNARTAEEQSWIDEQWKRMYEHQVDQPGMHELMQELRAVVDEYPDKVLLGETEEIAYYGDGTNELHLVFNFPLMKTERLTPAWVRANQAERLSTLPPAAWPCNTLGNHDSSRFLSHFGDGRNDAAWARIGLALVLTLRGTPVLYYGEEIGMTDLLLEDVEQFRDRLSLNIYESAVNLFGMGKAEATALAARMGRDKCRTPMQWAGDANGGFSPPDVRTWLPVNPNAMHGVNVADQSADPDSLLSDYRRLLRVRRENPALVNGDYLPLAEDSEEVLAFLRREPSGGQSCLVVLNMSDQPQAVHLGLTGQVRTLFSHPRRQPTAEDLSRLTVRPFEVYIGELLRGPSK